MVSKRLPAKQIYARRRDYLDIAKARNAYYEQTGDGPLVGYAGKYTIGDGKEYNFVGRAYINFAILKEYPHDDLDFTASALSRKIKRTLPWKKLSSKVVFCAAPIGGYGLSVILGQKLRCRTIKAEKKVLEVGKDGKRDKTKLILDRHEINEGDLVIIVEDVCNNFSTTWDLIKLLESYGATVIAIVCYLNRSPVFDRIYVSPDLTREFPIVALVRKQIDEFFQHDLRVADDIARGNICWKPKKKEQWAILMAAMKSKEP